MNSYFELDYNEEAIIRYRQEGNDEYIPGILHYEDEKELFVGRDRADSLENPYMGFTIFLHSSFNFLKTGISPSSLSVRVKLLEDIATELSIEELRTIVENDGWIDVFLGVFTPFDLFVDYLKKEHKQFLFSLLLSEDQVLRKAVAKNTKGWRLESRDKYDMLI